MRSRLGLALVCVWLLTAAASCETTFRSNNLVVRDSTGLGIAAVLVVGTVICLADTENCFLDEQKMRAQAADRKEAQSAFAAGLRRLQAGDPGGLEWICLAAHRGYANAQYFYGLHFYKQVPARTAEGAGWLARAAAQGHREADMLLRQVAGAQSRDVSAAPGPPAAVAPPALRSCVAQEVA